MDIYSVISSFSERRISLWINRTILNFIVTFLICFPQADSSLCSSVDRGTYGEAKTAFYPGNYSTLNCIWSITTPDNTSVFVKFLDFDVFYSSECQQDHVNILDLLSNQYLYNDNVCGSTLPPAVQSTGNRIKITINSTVGVGRGFKLEWRVGKELMYRSEPKTWTEASNSCAQEGGKLFTDVDFRQVADIMAVNNITSVWQGRYLTPWAWHLGCYYFKRFPNYTRSLESKSNQLKECVTFCRDSNFFGLQGRHCHCFDTYDGTFVGPPDMCTDSCPGNNNERCGGTNAVTVYMNDLCFNDSNLWQDEFSGTVDGKERIRTNSKLELDDSLGGSAVDAADGCRGFDEQGYIWCYGDGETQKLCDLPSCIGAMSNTDGVCMAVRKPDGERVILTSRNYSGNGNTTCETQGKMDCNISVNGIDTIDRQMSRNLNASNSSQCKTQIGPVVFQVRTEDKALPFEWLRFSRNVASKMDASLSYKPARCIIVKTTNGYQHHEVEPCRRRHPYICEKPQITCGKDVLLSYNGTILTPTNRDNKDEYPRFTHCVWRISAPVGHLLGVSVVVALEPSDHCSADSIRVYDGNSLFGPPLCGETAMTFNSSTGNIIVEFRTDGTENRYPGATITWSTSTLTTVPVPSTVTTTATMLMIGGAGSGGVILVVAVVAICLALKRKRRDIKNARRHGVTAADVEDRVKSYEANEILLANIYDDITDAKQSQVQTNNYHKMHKNSVGTGNDVRKGTESEVYNTVSTTRNSPNCSAGENIYNHFDDTDLVYDRTQTACGEMSENKKHLLLDEVNVYSKLSCSKTGNTDTVLASEVATDS